MRSTLGVLVATLMLIPPLSAQESDASARAPLFLLASTNPVSVPVVVDAASVSILRQRVRLNLENVALVDALDQISRVAKLQIVYADGVIPAAARVHLRADEITVAAALTDVLLDAGVDVVLLPSGSVVLVKRDALQLGVVKGRVTDAKSGLPIAQARVTLGGTSLVALTSDSGTYRIVDVRPGRYTLTVRRIGYAQGEQVITVVADQETTVDLRLEVSVTPLDAVVVTGTITPTAAKEISNPISIVTSEQIQQRVITQVNDLFRGDIPGVFAADYGENSATIGAPVYVRGTTELFDTPALKTYIDGIELANSEFLNEIDPNMIDHIEIVRGPQASTLYGAQAINGVMQVFTKRGRVGTPARLTGSLAVGSLEGPFGSALRHQDNLAVSGGTADVSYNAGFTYQHDGAWTRDHKLDVYSGYGALAIQPSGSSLRFDLSARVGQQNSQTGGAAGTARAMEDGTLTLDPLVEIPLRDRVSEPQLTLGMSVHFAPRSNWQHVFTAGLDRGANGSNYTTLPRYDTPSDSLLGVWSSQNLRATASYNGSWDTRLSRSVAANLILGADYWSYASSSFFTTGTTTDVGALGTSDFVYLYRGRDHSAGIFSQARLGIADALFLTAGVRVDQGPALPADKHHRSFNPRVGVSYALASGSVRGKLRAGYGSALKPARPDYKQYVQYTPTYAQLEAPNLRPEVQDGWDTGAEIYVGDRTSLSATYYRQIAHDLISARFVAYDPVFEYQFFNLARVRNTGWEVEGTLGLPAGFNARMTYSYVNSVIEQLAADDQTGYKVGDALPGIPNHTGVLSLAKRAGPFMAETAVSYVGTSRNYDVHAYLQRSHIRLGTPDGSFNLQTLPAAYRLALRASYDFTSRTTLFARCENATNRVVTDQGFYASDQVGRTTILGLRLR
ncbi:MAG TPA: TonB-dependent receptor [Gemmatimonadales bacterium]|nr:TonB-dependent receptor [Gemmatimonadales bacterium]